MQEWLNWPAWKASKPQKGFRGSNPLLSAKRRGGAGERLEKGRRDPEETGGGENVLTRPERLEGLEKDLTRPVGDSRRLVGLPMKS